MYIIYAHKYNTSVCNILMPSYSLHEYGRNFFNTFIFHALESYLRTLIYANVYQRLTAENTT